MKTIDDIRAIIPEIVEEIAKRDHEIGCQDETGHTYETNYYCYERNGYLIEVTYDCSGEWVADDGDYWTPGYCECVSAWGEVTEIIATHYDEETEEETIFSDDDLSELLAAIDKTLESIA